jgi:transposase
MGRKPKYSKEVKIKACKDYEKGHISFKGIADKIGTTKEAVRRWYLTYKEHGPSAFETSTTNKSYSKKFKLSVVEEYTSGKYSNMSYKDAADKYSITYALVYKWTRAYIDKGPESLEYQKRGPKPKSEIDESNLTEVEKLKLELEKERAIRKKKEFELEVLKKKKSSKKNFTFESKAGSRI